MVLRDFPFIVSHLLCGCLSWARHWFWYCSEIDMRYNVHSKILELVVEAQGLGRRKKKNIVIKGMQGLLLEILSGL